MKKEDVSGIIVYLLILVLAIVFGLTVLKTHQTESFFRDSFVWYIIVSIVIGLVFNAILFELGHIAGAKIGKYKILSVCILGFKFYKEDKKTKFKFSGYDGMTGETKIIPDYDNKDKKEPNPTAYLWFGTLFYVIELILVIVAFCIINQYISSNLTNAQMELKEKLGDLAYFLLIIGVIGFMILIYNILPFRLDLMTDGYRLKLVSNPKNREAFNELLRVEHEIELGNTDVEVKIFDEITNFTADLNLNRVYVLLDKRNFNEAEPLLDQILQSKDSISDKVFIRAKAQKIYINLMTKPAEESRLFYKANVTVSEARELSSDVSMASIRAYILMSGLLDKSRSECLIAINNVKRAFKATPKNRQAVEIDLFNEAILKVDAAHPDWELKDYILENKVNVNKA